MPPKIPSSPASEAEPQAPSIKQPVGPIIGDNGEYKPATYPTSRGLVRTDH